MPAFRLIAPYFKYVTVLVAIYIVWAAFTGVFGYFYRFMRFWAKLGPVLGIIGWLMASSGQGSLSDVMELVKQWVGISDPAQGGGLGGMAPGVAQLAGLFGLGSQDQTGTGNNKRNTRSSTNKKYKSKTGASDSSADTAFADILRSATGTQSNEDWQDTIQGYVKQTLAKASGLEWLFGGQAQEPAAERRRTR